MFRTITQRFKFMVTFLLFLFVANHILITVFISKLRNVQNAIIDLRSFTDDVMGLESTFNKVRYWEAMSINSALPDASQRYETNMKQIWTTMDFLLRSEVTEELQTYLQKADSLLKKYETDFHQLVQLISKRTINETDMNSVFEALAASRTLCANPNLHSLAMNMYRFHYSYLSHRQESTLKAVKIVLLSLDTHTATLDEPAREWVKKQIADYQERLDTDFATDQLISEKIIAVNMLNTSLTDMFSRIAATGDQYFNFEKNRSENIESRMLMTMLMSAVLGVMCISFVLVIVSRNIMHPIRRLHSVVDRVQQGDITARFETDKDDDINRLGNAFNHMLDTIKSNEDRLRNYQQDLECKIHQLSQSERDLRKQELHLEDMVQKRTQEMGEAMSKLRIEAEQRKAMEEQLRLSMYEAATANRAKSEFLSTMSHEIRTPLNGIIGMANFLRDTPLSVEQSEYMDAIIQSTSVLLGAVNDILDYAKYDSNSFTLERKRFNMHTTLEECLQLYTIEARRKHLILTAFYDPAIHEYFIGDRIRVRQIIGSLLSNAVKFTEQGEVMLEITARSVGENRVRINISCTDTGIGIPKDKQEHLFGMFNQANHSNTRKYGGVGIGLSICKKLVELMNGTIHVESTVGGGSEFTATICLDVESEDTQPNPQQRLFKNKSFILCNPWPVSSECIQRYLTFLGCAAKRANDPASLESLLNTRPFDACILFCENMEISEINLLINLLNKKNVLPVLMGRPAESSGDDTNLLEKTTVAMIPLPFTINQLVDRLRSVGEPAELQVLDDNKNTPPALEPINDQYPLNILLADDDVINQSVVKKYMLRLGYHIDVASDGMAAVEMTKKHHYDVIFMDIRMPIMNGLDAAREINATLSNRNKPWIIALTANAMDIDEQECYQSGMHEYITKPYTPESLRVALIRAWNGRQKLRSSGHMNA